VLIGDLNNDGKVDKEDAKIAARKARGTALKGADAAGKIGREILKHEMAKNAAIGAAVGAAIAIPIPFVGP
jgi:hypothetical protein